MLTAAGVMIFEVWRASILEDTIYPGFLDGFFLLLSVALMVVAVVGFYRYSTPEERAQGMRDMPSY